MVAGAFPIAKLAYLAVKQISKPLANRIKLTAKSNRLFRNYVCLPPAQFYHFVETRFKLYYMGFGKPTSVTPLNEQMAVELGAELLGEGIVFIAAAVTIFLEYSRQSRNTKAKEDEIEARFTDLEMKMKFLTELCEQQNERLKDVQRQFNNSSSIFKSFTDRLKLYSSEDKASKSEKIKIASKNNEDGKKSRDYGQQAIPGNNIQAKDSCFEGTDANMTVKLEHKSLENSQEFIKASSISAKSPAAFRENSYYSPGYGWMHKQDLTYFDWAVFEASRLILGTVDHQRSSAAASDMNS